MENPLDFGYDESEAILIFEQISKVPGALQLFRDIMGRDIKMHFAAKGDDERAGIKGAYARMAWMRGIMKNIEKYKALADRKSKREV